MILNNGEKAYNRVKEERCGSMKIKFDNITAKTAKYCALIFTVLLLIGLVFSFLEIPGTEVFYIMAVYTGVLVGLPCYVVLFAAKLYFARLRAYGYEIPDNKKIYGNNLNNLPKTREAGRSLFAKHSRIGMWMYFAFFVLFLVVDEMYLIKWHFMKGHFMKDICTFLFTVCLVLDSVWLILAVIMWRQRNTEKYRDDVECDKMRKERLNLENIIVFAIFWAIVCAVACIQAVTTTKYMDKVQRENAQVAASELKMADNTVELGNYES